MFDVFKVTNDKGLNKEYLDNLDELGDFLEKSFNKSRAYPMLKVERVSTGKVTELRRNPDGFWDKFNQYFIKKHSTN